MIRITAILLLISAMTSAQTVQKRTFWTDRSFSWNVVIADSIGNQAKSFDVYLQDQSTDIIDLYLCHELDTVILAADALIDTRTAAFEPGHGFVVDQWACIRSNGYWYQGRVTAVAGNNVTFDTPFNQTYTDGSSVRRVSPEMNVDGSVNRVIFAMGPAPGKRWDITRFSVALRDDAAMDDGKFGGLNQLANGLVVRAKKEEKYTNIFTARNNSHLAEQSSWFEYTDATLGPAGQYGFKMNRGLSGQENNGVVIRLDGDKGEQLQAIVQDNLTGLTYIRIIAYGHVVED